MILSIFIVILAAILVKYGKMYFLIAGYNTMSATKKRKYNIKRIANTIGNVLFAIAFLMSVGYILSKWLENPKIEMVSTNIAVIFGVLYLLIVLNSGKFKIEANR